MATVIINSIRDEYLRYKALAEGAIAQVDDASLSAEHAGAGNSIVTICWHISGNLRSRFTDFLTSDGEKPWRHRDEEFLARSVSRTELLAKWQNGWGTLFETLATLTDADLERIVTIRSQPLTVCEALHRSLAHASYHVGQIVLLGKAVRGPAWTSLSIPPGQSEAYRASPTLDRPSDHAAAAARAPRDTDAKAEP